MIEFKAECGHTVRARDEDAGSVVRCTYCGRNAEVPDKDAELDFLFRDVKQPEDPGKRRRQRRKPKPAAAADGKPSTFDPFTVVISPTQLGAESIQVRSLTARSQVKPQEEGDAAKLGSYDGQHKLPAGNLLAVTIRATTR